MEVEATQPLVETSSAEDEKICQGCPGTHVLSFPIQLPFMVNGPYPAHHEYGEKFIANPRADQLYGAIQLGLVYYDPEAQRGGLPYCMNQEPPSKRFPFDPTKVEAMAEKLEKGILFGDHLTWNLRPGGAHWWYDRKTNRLWVDRTSKIFLPDSHHRHRAVFLVCEKAAKGGSRFRADSKTFTLDIFMMSIEGEQALFHEFNVEGKKADRTRAFYIVPSSWDDAKGVAKELLSISPFYNNVEVIRNRLSKNSSNVITFATLRDGIADNATKVSPVDIDPASGEKKVSSAAVEFYRTWFDRVATVRHELRPTTIVERQQIRQTSLVDQGIVWRAWGTTNGRRRGTGGACESRRGVGQGDQAVGRTVRPREGREEVEGRPVQPRESRLEGIDRHDHDEEGEVAGQQHARRARARLHGPEAAHGGVTHPPLSFYS